MNDKSEAVLTIYVKNGIQTDDLKLTSKINKHIEKAILDQYFQTRNYKKLKKVVRQTFWNITDPVRKDLWLSLCRLQTSNTKINAKNFYEELRAELFEEGGGDGLITTLPPFVDKEYFFKRYLSDDGISISCKILCVINHERPDIVYCPLLLPLVSLFLHFHEEALSYECASAMVLTRTADRYITQTRIAHLARSMVLKELLLKYSKSSYQFILRNCENVDTLFNNWLKWIFRDLPFIYTIKIIDCYLCEGPKVLFRFALSILVHFHKLTGNQSFKKKDISMEVENFCQNIPVTIDVLFKTAFSIRGLSRNQISKINAAQEIVLRSKKNLEDLKEDKDAFSLQPNMGKQAGGEILTDTMWRHIYGWLPKRQTLKKPVLLFSTSEHGTSLNTFYSKVEGHEPTVLIIKTSCNELIGGYISLDWAERKGREKSVQYFGTGESFVFSLKPLIEKYPWVGVGQMHNLPPSANLFAMGDATQFVIGGGNGTAIMLDGELLNGVSTRCDTFANAPLVTESRFIANVVEVFALI